MYQRSSKRTANGRLQLFGFFGDFEIRCEVDCSSISPDGTDFRLTKPDGQPLAIESITANCDNNFEASQMTIKLFKPLTKNGKYFLYSKVGNDGNTLLNKCGFPMNEFDTIQLNVEGCFNADYQLENVTIEDDKNPVIEWSADTSSYPNYLFQNGKSSARSRPNTMEQSGYGIQPVQVRLERQPNWFHQS